MIPIAAAVESWNIQRMRMSASGRCRFDICSRSTIIFKAREIVKVNGMSDKITLLQGKMEEIHDQMPFKNVDIIISEWMGYFLLYESMLDSVLHARDRFLRADGVMAPSQTQMMFALCEASELYKERIGFWSDVYGEHISLYPASLTCSSGC